MNASSGLVQTLFEQRAKPRGDEALTHVADLTTCLRAVAYRRRGVRPDALTQAELAKFAIGLGYEGEVAQTLTDAGHIVEENLEVQPFGLDVGHPDLFVDGQLLIECKTTSGGANYPKSDKERAGQPRGVSTHHAIQASAYAIGLGATKAVVLVNHIGFAHEEVAHDVNPEQYRDQIEMLAREVIALTGPEMPLPAAEPKPLEIVPYDECGYCRYRMCARNPKYDPALEATEILA